MVARYPWMGLSVLVPIYLVVFFLDGTEAE
jgi:hypothetical protein